MINWQRPIRCSRTLRPARWLGTIRRRDGLNFVVATTNTEGDEEVGVFNIEGKKNGTEAFNLENYRA